MTARDQKGNRGGWNRAKLLRQTHDYLRMCYANGTPARVSELASFLSTEREPADRSYLVLLFHAFIGTTPADFLRNRQVAYAKWLLGSTTLRNSEIAERAGFGTRNTFERVFKLRTGMSPSEYRAQRQHHSDSAK
jgi:AraC-like DNA-binding protein